MGGVYYGQEKSNKESRQEESRQEEKESRQEEKEIGLLKKPV